MIYTELQTDKSYQIAEYGLLSYKWNINTIPFLPKAQGLSQKWEEKDWRAKGEVNSFLVKEGQLYIGTHHGCDNIHVQSQATQKPRQH